MSQIALDFLLGSFLMDSELISSNYSSILLPCIENELSKYRDHILSNLTDIQGEIHQNESNLNICIDSFGNLPQEDLYKQLALYMDQIVIPDPLFELTEKRAEIQSTFSKFMGLSDKQLNKEDVGDAIQYINHIYSLIVSGLVKLLPISLIHETPEKLPIKYSEDGFEGHLPRHILDHYKSISHVCNVKRGKGSMSICCEEPLRLGTTIHVSFEDNEHSAIYQFVQTKSARIDENTNELSFMNYIPDTISPEVFSAWVNQSINQAAIHHFSDTFQELQLSKKVGCMYLTRSQLTADILKVALEPNIKANLATMAMKLNLPVFSRISLSDILSIRINEGESFHNFRTELNTRMLKIRDCDDLELQKQLDIIAYELSELQVRDVEKEYRKIKRALKLDAVALTGSLLLSYISGGLTLLGAAGMLTKGAIDATRYNSNVKEHNGFFLWKVNKLAQKTSI